MSTLTHGLRYHPVYRVWAGMKQRCYNPNNDSYKDYGGRGIKIFDKWLNNFQEFYNWSISNNYQKDLTIDRINNDGNYEPGNCRWVTHKIQNNNYSKNKLITFNNKTQNYRQWEIELKLSRGSIYQRLKRGWSIQKTLTTIKSI